jgi:cob(I)alamin adenosyltransferase
MAFYTKRGDDGSTGLRFGGRVSKASPRPEAVGAVDEAQAAIGVARAELEATDPVNATLLSIERDLYVLMAELATAPSDESRLEPDVTRVSASMLAAVQATTDDWSDMIEVPKGFVLPGGNRASALLDQARTVVRRAERRCIGLTADDSFVIPYLNRLSSALWVAARLYEPDTPMAKTYIKP